MMENMQYAEEIVREFLVFRGFTSTLQIYENELSTDIGAGFQVDKILELIFSVYVPNFRGDKLVSLLTFLKQCVCSSTETVLISTLSKLEVSALKYYVVHALQSERRDKVVEFFETNGNDLLQRHSEWMSWFAIPYLKNPRLNPQFRVYFSKEWYDALLLSFRNFLNEIFNGIRIPALLKISTEKNTVKHLKTDIKQLNTRLSELQALLEVRETEIQRLRSMAQPGPESSLHWMVGSSSNSSPSLIPLDHQSNISSSEDFNKHSTTVEKKPILNTDNSASSSSNVFSETTPNLQGNSSTTSIQSPRDDRVNENESWLAFQEGRKQVEEEEFPEVKVEFQESFLGHTSPISKCRFSASGSNIASASIDGTVRVWTYDESTPTSRNATIYCGAEIMSLDWECRYDRLLLIGTADGGIKAWNVDAKRVVCDLSTTPEFPSVLDLKCSPVEPIFVSAASSRRSGSDYNDGMGFASLTVWNMKTWKAMTILPLGKDPPTITSMCFNHNGKILAAAATDGMIHMFDMSAGLQITGWPAHDSAVSSVLFGPDETSIFSLGSDGKIFEWSLQNQGHVLWSRDCRSFFSPESSNICRHEIALDSNGKRLLVTSDTVRSPLYQVQGHLSGLKSLAHSSRITTVDWHPTLPIYVTGSADHSVRVTCTL